MFDNPKKRLKYLENKLIIIFNFIRQLYKGGVRNAHSTLFLNNIIYYNILFNVNIYTLYTHTYIYIYIYIYIY